MSTQGLDLAGHYYPLVRSCRQLSPIYPCFKGMDSISSVGLSLEVRTDPSVWIYIEFIYSDTG